jgi:four helix bundle protein
MGRIRKAKDKGQKANFKSKTALFSFDFFNLTFDFILNYTIKITTMNQINLQDRLINFSVDIIKLTDKFPNDFACRHLSRQIIRSSTSSALNYGESQAAESRADFIHKHKIVLKELKETLVCLKILQKRAYLSENNFEFALKECKELVAIFITSLKTAQKNRVMKNAK